MKLKIVVLDGYAENPGDLSWEGFEKLGEFTCHDRTPAEQVIERIGDAEIVIVNKTPITRAMIEACGNIQYIGVLATGYNIVDTAAAKEKGIVVTNIPTYGTEAVSQFAFALLLEICHHVGHHSDAVFEGRWERNPDWTFWDYPLIELLGKTMGIIGYGRIGQTTANIAQAFGMKVLANSPSRKPEVVSESLSFVDLDELLAKSDIITLHCPLLPSTEGIISKESIAKMKDGVIIINNSRGPLIVEQDLVDALESGKVAAAGLDVASSEPIRGDNPLLKAKNCLITPHISWAPIETRARLMDLALENLKAFLDGTPIHVVNR
jgi:glycerate dehydrogenase